VPHFKSLIDIFYNWNESFCTWLTEIVHSSNFKKAVIYVHNFQGFCDTTLIHCWFFRNPNLNGICTLQRSQSVPETFMGGLPNSTFFWFVNAILFFGQSCV